jgi:hypothetical protein
MARVERIRSDLPSPIRDRPGGSPVVTLLVVPCFYLGLTEGAERLGRRLLR